jgi:hypothetical protein
VAALEGVVETTVTELAAFDNDVLEGAQSPSTHWSHDIEAIQPIT